MNNNKYLTKNIFLFAISNFAPKILVFLMVPLYTNVLTTEEYGTVDLMQTLIQLLLPILTLNICEAVMRFSLDPDCDDGKVFTYGVRYSIIGILIISLSGVVLFLLNIVPLSYLVCFLLLFASNTIFMLISNFLRGIEQITLMVVGSILNTAVMVGCNLLFLLLLRWGIEGYLLAQSSGFLAASIIWIFVGKLWKYLGKNKRDKSISRRMRQYSEPLIVNSVAWWINNASSRYIITFFSGAAMNGLYAAAYKIPTILTMMQNIFMQAWQLSAIKTYNQEERNEFYKKIYSLYNALLILATSAIVLLVKVIAKILFAKDFYVAWKIVPFLLIASLFGALSGFVGAIFSASNDTKVVGRTTAYGAAFNILFGVVLIWKMDIIGAATATLISYFLVWLIRCNEERKREQLVLINKKSIMSYVLLLVQGVVLQADTWWSSLISLFVFLTLCLLYYNFIKNELLQKIIVILKRRKESNG